MPDKKLTDNEIIKALECCSNPALDCHNCSMPIEIREDCKCMETLCRQGLDLINRQKAEIERLTAGVERLADESDARDIDEYNMVCRVRAEAIKDVLLTLEAEAVSSDKYIREYDDSEVQKAYNQALWKAYNLVKEMVGDAE